MENESFDMEKMLHMLSLFKQYQEQEAVYAQAPAPPARENDDYDACIQTPQLRALKAAIPHMEPHYRQPLSIVIKLAEIRRLNGYYSQATPTARKDSWQHDMIHAMHPHLPPEQQQQLALLSSLLRAKSIIEAMKQEREEPII